MKIPSVIHSCRLIGPGILLLAAAAATLPQVIKGVSCGHDFDFHMLGWLEALNSWRQGTLYPHWAATPNFGAGEPRFVFYPPLTWMLGALLRFVIPKLRWTPLTEILLLLWATGLGTRALARELLTEGASTLAGCAAIFSGYALFTAYERSAFGELSGGLWIPLLLLYILRDRMPAASLPGRAFDGSALPLTLVVAGAWLSNVPVGVMASYLLAAIALVAAALRRSWAPIVRATTAAAIGIGLACFYLVPATWEQRWVDVKQVTDDPGERIENSWMFARHADPALEYHDTVLLKASIIAVTMLALTLVCMLIVLWRDRKRGKLIGARSISRPQALWLPLALIAPAILFLLVPASLPVWNLLPKLRYLQFPWRWLVVLEGPMAVFFAAAAWPARRWARVAATAVCALIFAGAAASAGFLFLQGCDSDDSPWGIQDAFRSGAGVAGTDEYEPPGADDGLVPMGLPGACLVSDPMVALGAPSPDTNPTWDPAQHTCAATYDFATHSTEHLRIAANVPRGGYLVLRLRRYPAWRVTLNGKAAATFDNRDDGLIAVAVEQGPVRLTIDWTTTGDVIAGRWLSGFALLLLAGLGWMELRLARPHLS